MKLKATPLSAAWFSAAFLILVIASPVWAQEERTASATLSESDAEAESESDAEAESESESESEAGAGADSEGEAEGDPDDDWSWGDEDEYDDEESEDEPTDEGNDFSFDLPVLGRTTFSMVSTTTVRYRGNNYDANLVDDDFLSIYQRLDLALQSDELRAEGRIDAFVPLPVFEDRCADLPLGSENPQCYLDWDLRPERLTLRWEHEDWTLEAGDSQLVLGRGVALSFRKVDLLGIDTALRGGHVRYEGSNFQFRVHGGVANPQNQDPIDLRIIDEREDIVAGGALGFTMPGSTPISVRGHALRVMFEDDNMVTTGRAVDVAGWSIEAPALLDGQLALYGEANGMRRTQYLVDNYDITAGRGIYASAQLSLAELTILVEWKDYTNFLVAPITNEGNAWRIYNAAPAVEFNGPQRLRSIGNQRGGGIRIDYAFLPGPWSFSVNSVAYGFNEEFQHDPWDEGIFVTHSWVRLAKRQEYGGDINWSMDVTLGARFETLMHDVPGTDFAPGDLDRWMLHGRAELTLGSGDHSFDFVVDHRHERELIGADTREFQIGGANVTYTFGVPLVLALGLRWTDFQPGVVQARGEREYNFLGGEFYPSLEGRWTFEPGTYLSVFVGQTPGGQICSGGVCRDVPTFEGVRVSFVGRL